MNKELIILFRAMYKEKDVAAINNCYSVRYMSLLIVKHFPETNPEVLRYGSIKKTIKANEKYFRVFPKKNVEGKIVPHYFLTDKGQEIFIAINEVSKEAVETQLKEVMESKVQKLLNKFKV